MSEDKKSAEQGLDPTLKNPITWGEWFSLLLALQNRPKKTHFCPLLRV
jgi:hypothetical protein